MHWSRPSWWPDDAAPATIIHCDELNRAQQEDTLQAIFQFVEPPAEGRQRGLHTHRLHPKHKVVVSINPPDGTYQVATLDRALIDRMVILYVETDYPCWARYATSRNLDQEVRAFLSANHHLLAQAGAPLDLQIEPSERAWEMVSILRQHCRFPVELEMEVYAGIVGREAAVIFLRWCAEQEGRPLTAVDILDHWLEVGERAAAQRDDRQAATIHDLIATLAVAGSLSTSREAHLVAYLAILPRDLRFGLIKSLLRLPLVATALAQDKYDSVVLEAMRTISREA